MVVVFFSSRRRNTRCSRDWSSDVCSSDLMIRKCGGDSVQHFSRSLARGEAALGELQLHQLIVPAGGQISLDKFIPLPGELGEGGGISIKSRLPRGLPILPLR